MSSSHRQDATAIARYGILTKEESQLQSLRSWHTHRAVDRELTIANSRER